MAGAAIEAVLHALFDSNRLDSSPKTVLITGAGSGLGKAVADRFAAKGHLVFRCDVAFADSDDSNVIMDVTSNSSVDEAISQLKVSKLDAVFNFAGIIRNGPLAEVDLDSVMAVNFLGTARVNKACLELLLKGCVGGYRSRIINVASEVAYARLSAPFNAPYAVSKLAVWAYSNALRSELRTLSKNETPFVVVLHPGAFVTPLLNSPENDFSIIAERSRRWKTQLKERAYLAKAYTLKHGRDPTVLAIECERLLNVSKPPLEIQVNASWEMFFASLVPQRLLDALLDWT